MNIFRFQVDYHSPMLLLLFITYKNIMASSVLSSTCASAADLLEPFQIIQNEVNKRFEALLRVEGYILQKSPQLVRMFIRIVKNQIECQNGRVIIEKQVIESMKNTSLTKKLKKKLTDFSFSFIQKLNPSLNINIQKHSNNLMRLYQSYFQSMYQPEYLKKINNIKLNHPNYKVEIFVHLLQLLLEHVSVSFKNRMQDTLQALSIKSKKSAQNVLVLKKKIIRQKQQQIQQIRQKQTKLYQHKFKTKLPSLKSGLLIQKFRDNATSLSNKLNNSEIQVFGRRPSNKASMDMMDQSFKELRMLNISFKNKTDMNLYPSPKKKQSLNKKNQLQTLATQQKKGHKSMLITNTHELKLKQFKIANRVANPVVRTVNSKEDFLGQFSSNLSELSKIINLDDHQIQYSRKNKYKKDEWMLLNEPRLVEILISKNLNISKQISMYAVRYDKSAS